MLREDWPAEGYSEVECRRFRPAGSCAKLGKTHHESERAARVSLENAVYIFDNRIQSGQVDSPANVSMMNLSMRTVRMKLILGQRAGREGIEI